MTWPKWTVPQTPPSLEGKAPPPPLPEDDAGLGTQTRRDPPALQTCPLGQLAELVQRVWQTPKSQIDPLRQSVSTLQAWKPQDPPKKAGWHIIGIGQSPEKVQDWAIEFDAAKSDRKIAKLIAIICRVIRVIGSAPWMVVAWRSYPFPRSR